MKLALFLMVGIPLLACSQTNVGIQFTQEVSWNEIISAATAEKKYIFVDCYATWCGPCKKMDSTVYQSEVVGDFANKKFISIKLQVDSTNSDEEKIKLRYQIAKLFVKRYKISDLPTYLFFSPNGTIVHRDVGFKSVPEFINILSSAIDSSKQIYTLVKNYKIGEKDYINMGQLALKCKMLDNNIADEIATDYKKNYFDKLSDSALCTKENIDFISTYSNLICSGDRIFKLFYYNSRVIDSVMKYPGFSRYYVDQVIKKEEVYKVFCMNDNIIKEKPQWEEIKKAITRKYDRLYAERIVSVSQIEFYKKNGEWEEYADVVDMLIRKYPPEENGKYFAQFLGGISAIGDAWGLNVQAWNVFLNCNSKGILTRALKWSNLSIRLQSSNNAQYLDTKANLLYKLGKAKEAIEIEKKAIIVDKVTAQKNGRIEGPLYAEFSSNIEKMKLGIPTWE